MFKNNKKGLIAFPVFIFLVIISISILIFSYFYYENQKERFLIENEKREISNEIHSFRSAIIEILRQENTTFIYNSSTNKDIYLYFDNSKQELIAETYLNNNLIIVKISSVGIPFEENFSYTPSRPAELFFNGSEIQFLNYLY
jgi:hypothetical protein